MGQRLRRFAALLIRGGVVTDIGVALCGAVTAWESGAAVTTQRPGPVVDDKPTAVRERGAVASLLRTEPVMRSGVRATATPRQRPCSRPPARIACDGG